MFVPIVLLPSNLLLILWDSDYANAMYTGYLPILSSVVFDNTGSPYNVTKILTEDYQFDQEAYKRYSRVFMPVT